RSERSKFIVADQHCARGGILKAGQYNGNARFARTSVSQQRNELAELNGQIDVVKHIFFAVRESHIVKADGGGVCLQRFRLGRLRQRRLDDEQIINRINACSSQGQLAVQAAEVLHRRIE